MREFDIIVPVEAGGRRLDLFLYEYFLREAPGLSRTAIQKMILEKKVPLLDGLCPKPHYKVKSGDRFRAVIVDKKSGAPVAEDILLDVVYEDDDLAVINKPAGLVVHPAPGNYEHTLVNALLHRFGTLSDINPQRPGIVHRLDKETSGLLVVAKNNFSHLELAAQFAKHSIERTYLAVVKGKMEFDQSVIEMPIGRHPRKRKNMSVGFGDKTKYAKTFYRTLKRRADCSLVELKPFTGRTHQLRVHLAFIGHPIMGDAKYGGPPASRMCLHALSIGFIHPRTKKIMRFSSPRGTFPEVPPFAVVTDCK